jgi:hypothetical protein
VTLTELIWMEKGKENEFKQPIREEVTLDPLSVLASAEEEERIFAEYMQKNKGQVSPTKVEEKVPPFPVSVKKGMWSTSYWSGIKESIKYSLISKQT